MSQTKDFWVNPHLDTAQLQGDNPENYTNQTSLIEFLCSSLSILWKEWPKDMELSVLDNDKRQFSLRGTCPHCQSKSVFMSVTDPYTDQIRSSGNKHRVASVMQCQGCRDFILGIAIQQLTRWVYENHYPLGTPNDSVDEHVPEAIAADFAEAMRCLFVKSPKASVAMCRRAVEASCNDLGAKGGNLKAKINDLAERRKITDSLQAMAHAVRLTANARLHGKQKPPANQEQEMTGEVVTSDLDSFGESDAKEMISFVRHFFYHVYVVPELLKPYQSAEGEALGEIQADADQNVGSTPNSKID